LLPCGTDRKIHGASQRGTAQSDGRGLPVPICRNNNVIDWKTQVGLGRLSGSYLKVRGSNPLPARAQIATIEAQLSDQPDPVIVRQAGRTLRNITEGAIAGLIAAAVQPTVWDWIQAAMARLFS
jgi:hypothetical protein